MDILFDRGLHLPSLDLWMDSLRARPGCWVSHGHTDHIAAHRRFLATGPTADFLQARHKRSEGAAVEYGQPVEAPGYRVTLYPAGHCLGSAQMLVELESTGRRIVYTGDLKLQPNPTADPAPIIPCDTLVIESTFGHPAYAFPPQEETLDHLCGFIDATFDRNQTPVLLVYSLGKAQEVLWHLLARGYRVRYDPTTAAIVERYQRWGVTFDGDHGPLDASVQPAQASDGRRMPGTTSDLDLSLRGAGGGGGTHGGRRGNLGEGQTGLECHYPAADREEAEPAEQSRPRRPARPSSPASLRDTVVLLPPGARHTALYRSIPRPRTAFLTGWALDERLSYRFHADEAFPLSDHAGFPDLLRYVHESGARRVYTVNGFPNLAGHLAAQHIAATHLRKLDAPLQLSLAL